MAIKPKKKFRENYFQQQIAKSGPNFLETMPLDRMKLDAVRIFRELAKGNIDISDYAEYFHNQRFLESLIDTAQTKFNIHSVSAAGVQMLVMTGNNTSNVISVLEMHENAAKGYKVIVDYLTAFRNYQDDNLLVDLVYNVVKYRYYI